VPQLGLNSEQSIHNLVLPKFAYFKTEFILHKLHNELAQLRQLDIAVQIEQVIEFPEVTNPYYVGELQVVH
jgi:hypothetical protein